MDWVPLLACPAVPSFVGLQQNLWIKFNLLRFRVGLMDFLGMTRVFNGMKNSQKHGVNRSITNEMANSDLIVIRSWPADFRLAIQIPDFTAHKTHQASANQG